MNLDKVKVGLFINAALKYKGDKYSQAKRLQKGYSDCSSLIQKALNDINLNTRKKVTVTTHRMGVEGDSRFRLIPKSQMQRGDILWGGNYVNGKWEGHVAIYLGEGKTLEARVKEGVDFNKDRPYFTKVYRIVALEEVAKPKEQPKEPKPVKTGIVENVELDVLGKVVKGKVYIVDGISYVDIDKKGIPVRKFFETLGFEVEWKNGKIYIK